MNDLYSILERAAKHQELMADEAAILGWKPTMRRSAELHRHTAEAIRKAMELVRGIGVPGLSSRLSEILEKAP